MTSLLINEKETSMLLNVSVSKLQKSRTASSNLINEGKLPPFVKIDGKVLYVRAEVEAFVKNLIRYTSGGNKFISSLTTEQSKRYQKTDLVMNEQVPITNSEIPEGLLEMCDFLN